MKQTILLIIITATLLMMGACDEKVKYNSEADHLIESAYQTKNYKQLATIADSLQKKGQLSEAEAYYWQGYAYDRMKRLRTASFFWEHAIKAAEKSNDPRELSYYAKSACRLANVLTMRRDGESTLKIGIPVAHRLESLKCDTTSDYVNLLIYIGCCQIHMDGSKDSVNASFNRAYKKHKEDIEVHHNDEAYKNAFAGVINIIYNYNGIQHYEDALKWNERYGKFITEYEQRQDVDSSYVDKQWARYDIYRAVALQGLRRNEEAAEAYRDFLSTKYSLTSEGHILANEYLELAGRWQEAATNYENLDKMFELRNIQYTLDNIQSVGLRKFHANQMAGRRDSAMAVSIKISEMLDSAIANSRRTEVEEQDTTRAKLQEITIHQESIVRKRMTALMIALFVAIGIFIAYILYQIWMRHRISKAHQELETAYKEVKAMTFEKERQQTEQRIFREIQLADIPPLEPKDKKMAFCATSKTNGTATADFIDYRLNDDKLWFCAGGAQGNSVKDSFSAALVKSQFRSMAALGIAPEQIVTAVNTTMTSGNYSPVSLFVGVLELTTGRLQYCNAGHPAPVLAATEIGLLPTAKEDAIGGSDECRTFSTHEIVLEPSNMLFLYTNTLSSIENANHRKFGTKRILGEALQQKKTNASAELFIQHMTESVQRFIGNDSHTQIPLMLAIQSTR